MLSLIKRIFATVIFYGFSGMFCMAFILFFIKCVILLIGDPSYDTSKFTTYGFAIIVSFGSLIFNWSRALDSEKKADINRLIRYAGDTVMSGVLFLLASAIKFMLYTSKDGKPVKFDFDLWFYITLFLFSLATLLFAQVLFRLIGFYIERISWIKDHVWPPLPKKE